MIGLTDQKEETDESDGPVMGPSRIEVGIFRSTHTGKQTSIKGFLLNPCYFFASGFDH